MNQSIGMTPMADKKPLPAQLGPCAAWHIFRSDLDFHGEMTRVPTDHRLGKLPFAPGDKTCRVVSHQDWRRFSTISHAITLRNRVCKDDVRSPDPKGRREQRTEVSMASIHLDKITISSSHPIANFQMKKIMPSLSHTSEAELAMGIMKYKDYITKITDWACRRFNAEFDHTHSTP